MSALGVSAAVSGRQLHKFGGSSLADVKCYQRIAGIMAEYSRPGDLMVVSAAGGTTNQLISWLKLSQSDRLSAHQVQQALRRYQSDLIAGLLPADAAERLTTLFIRDLERLAAPVLHARTLQPVSASDIDLQLRCSYNPEQGSTRIERVLASGTGAKIVTSHYDVCLIDVQIPTQHDFARVHKEIEQYVSRAQVRPLAIGVHADRNLVQLCYTSEVVDSAWHALEQAGLPVTFTQREGLALVAMVGAGVCRNPLHSHRFYQQLKDQPIEFVWQSDDGISLVAVLRVGPTEHLIRGLHQSLFRAEKRIWLVLFGKGNIGSRWLELFAREQALISARTGFEFVLAGVVDSPRSLLNYDWLEASRVCWPSLMMKRRSVMVKISSCGCVLIPTMTWWCWM